MKTKKKNKRKQKFKICNNPNKINFIKILLRNMLFIILFSIYFSDEQKHIFRKLNFAAQIIVTIKGTGDKAYISDSSYTRPENVAVEGSPDISCNIYTKKCGTLVDEINNITMSWNSPPINFYRLFFCLTHITHVYFLGVDSSQVTNMYQMFYGCSNLEYIDFSNFDTSSTSLMNSMFYGCTLLKSIDLSNFDTSKVTTMEEMFRGCNSLVHLNISNFKMDSLENMGSMFKGCSELKELDLNNIDTSNVIIMSSLFQGCSSLSSINLTNLNTKSVTNMGGMFRECNSLKYLDLTFLNTSSVTNMQGMFQDSHNLISLNLSNLDMSKVENFESMFYACNSLETLDVSNVDVSSVTTMNSMFYDCYSLTTLDLSSFVTSSLNYMKNTFQNCHSLISLNINNFDTSHVSDMSLSFYNCTNLISLNLESFDTSSVISTVHDIFNYVNKSIIFCSDSDKISSISSHVKFISDCSNTCFSEDNIKLLVENKECTTDCSNDDTYKLEYKNICFEECPDNTHASYDNLNLCQIKGDGFYLENNIYMPCYSSCKICNGFGNEDNHNCVECIIDYIFINETGKENNCYRKCDYYYYFDHSGNYQCTEANECPEEYNKSISQKGKCVDQCSRDDTFQYEYNNECLSECPPDYYCTLNNSFLCVNNPDGYYFDINIYRPCYFSCNNCYGEGNENNHNCESCKIHYKVIPEMNNENNCYKDCDYYYFIDDSGNYQCTTEDSCPDEKNKKIESKKKCIDNCTNEIPYIYEYNNVCYNECPNNTYLTTDNNYLCQKNPEGYYLDINIYKPCYPLCKKCNEGGTSDFHNCEECISGYHFLDGRGIENNCYEICEFFYFEDSGNYICSSNNGCPSEKSKYILDKDICIEKCEDDDENKVEYNNTCYKNCPNDSHITSDNINLCKINPEGYYLDVDIYKPCFPTCKTCNGEGDENNHNCKECILNYIFLNESGKEQNCYRKCDYYYYFDISGNYQCSTNNECQDQYNKMIPLKKKCIDNCTKDDTYFREYNNICDKTCPDDTHLTIDNNYLCKKNPEGYYLDNNIYKHCYELCKTCNGEGNSIINNCLECISNYNLILNPDNIKNCYIKCDYYYYFDNSNNYHCTEGYECPIEQNKLIREKSKCIYSCSNDDIYKYEDNNICVKYLPDKDIILICPIDVPFEKSSECIEQCTAREFLTEECKLNNKNNKTAQNDIIEAIKNGISNKNLNDLLANIKEGEKKDIIIDDIDIIYQITSSENQNNNEYDNVSKILLGDCEEKLKKQHGISQDESLIIFKIDVHEEGLLIPIIEYEIYNPINLEKLNLSICEDTKIGISIPVNIDEDKLFIYNSSHDYYNDICYSYTTDNGTDIVVKDRQSEYINNNYSLCEANCEFSMYDKEHKKAICECQPKLVLNSISDIKENKDLLLKTFTDVKSIVNLDLLKCYNKFLNKEGLLKNTGSYIVLSVILLHLISVFVFKIKEYKIIYDSIQEILKEKKENAEETKKNRIKDKNSVNIYQKIKKKKSLKKKKKLNKEKKSCPPSRKRKKSKTKSTKVLNEEISLKSNSKLELKFPDHKLSHKKLSHKILALKNRIDNKIENKKSDNNIKMNFKNYINNMKISIYNDYELNSLLYEEALEIDKRTYLQYYVSLLRQKHLVIFALCSRNDYNSKIIKIFLFFFSFALYLTVNALFFNYNTMSKIYKDQGEFNFIFQLPQIIYSTLISTFINMIIRTLALSQKNIVEIKRETGPNIFMKIPQLLKCLSIKFIIFFILSFVLLIFFWFYLGCFCAVYPNTQIHLITDTAISFLLTLVYPFFMNLLPGLLRIPSLKSVNKDKECLYKFSQIIHLI